MGAHFHGPADCSRRDKATLQNCQSRHAQCTHTYLKCMNGTTAFLFFQYTKRRIIADDNEERAYSCAHKYSRPWHVLEFLADSIYSTTDYIQRLP